MVGALTHINCEYVAFIEYRRARQSNGWQSQKDGSENQTFISNFDRTMVVWHTFEYTNNGVDYARVWLALADAPGAFNFAPPLPAADNVVANWCCVPYDGAQHYITLQWAMDSRSVSMALDFVEAPISGYSSYSNWGNTGYFQVWLEPNTWYIGRDSDIFLNHYGIPVSRTTPKGVATSVLYFTVNDCCSGTGPADIFVQQGGVSTSPPYNYNQSNQVVGDYIGFILDPLSDNVIIEDIQIGQ